MKRNTWTYYITYYLVVRQLVSEDYYLKIVFVAGFDQYNYCQSLKNQCELWNNCVYILLLEPTKHKRCLESTYKVRSAHSCFLLPFRRKKNGQTSAHCIWLLPFFGATSEPMYLHFTTKTKKCCGKWVGSWLDKIDMIHSMHYGKSASDFYTVCE